MIHVELPSDTERLVCSGKDTRLRGQSGCRGLGRGKEIQDHKYLQGEEEIPALELYGGEIQNPGIYRGEIHGPGDDLSII